MACHTWKGAEAKPYVMHPLRGQQFWAICYSSHDQVQKLTGGL